MVKLFHGKTTYVSLKNAEKICLELRNNHPNYEFITINGDTDDTEKIGSAYKSIGMFSAGKILFIKRLSSNKNKAVIIEDLTAFIKDNPEIDTDLLHIVIWEDQKVASNTRYFKFFQAIKAVEEAPEMNKRTFITWAKSAITEKQMTAETDALQLLAERCNYEAERFNNELIKIELSGKSKITIKDVSDNSSDTFEYQIWDLIDALNSGDSKTSIILENLFRNNLDPIYILAMMAWNLKQLVLVSYLIDKNLGQSEICSKLRIPPFRIYSLISSAKRIGFQKICLLYEKVNSLDYEVKTGGIDGKLGLSMLQMAVGK